MAGRVMSYVYCLFFFSWHWLFSKSQLQILYWITQNNLLMKLFAIKILISFYCVSVYHRFAVQDLMKYSYQTLQASNKW